MRDPEFMLLGDALWLDFVNTADTPPGQRDALPDASAYLRWTKAVRVEPPVDRAGFAEARAFRGRLLLLARALQEGRSPPPSAVEAINARLGALDGREQLVRVGGSWRLRFAPVRAAGGAAGRGPVGRADPGQPRGHDPPVRQSRVRAVLRGRLAAADPAAGAPAVAAGPGRGSSGAAAPARRSSRRASPPGR